MTKHFFSSKKTIFFCCFYFTLFSLFAYSQDSSDSLYDDDDEEYVEEVLEESALEDKTKINTQIKEQLEKKGINLKEKKLEGMLENLQKNNGDLLKKAKKLLDSGELTPLKMLETLKSSDQFKETDSRSKLMEQTLKPFKSMSDNDLKKQILENTKGSFAGKQLRSYPKILKFMVKWLKDDKAMPYLVTISQKKFLGMIYLIFIIFSFILSFWLKRKAIRKNLGLIKGIASTVKRLVFFAVLRISVFIYLFYEQVSPTIDIIKNL